MKRVEKEKRKLKRGEFELQRRRLNWSISVKPRILDFCRKFADEANCNGYPYRLFCNQGSTDINAETIQFGIGINYTGIEKFERIHSENSITNKHTKVLEKGSALVFSQSPSGDILVLLYPYKSEVHQRTEEYIILHGGVEPDHLTNKLVLKALYKSLFYARLSSLNGIANGYSLLDRASLFKMNFFDTRSRMKRRNNILDLDSEWWKIIITATATLIITLVAQKFY